MEVNDVKSVLLYELSSTNELKMIESLTIVAIVTAAKEFR